MILLSLITVRAAVLFIDMISASATEYSNYSSNKYQIQFQYPANWTLTEKPSRFDDGIDISISNFIQGFISVEYGDDLVTDFRTRDVQSATVNLFKKLVCNDFSKVYKVLETPSSATIDGHKAGMFLYIIQDKYGENLQHILRKYGLLLSGTTVIYLVCFSCRFVLQHRDYQDSLQFHTISTIFGNK